MQRRYRRPHFRALSAGGMGLLAGLLALGAVGCEEQAAPVIERPPALVRVAKAEAREVPIYLEEIGRCVAREMVAIQPQVSGRIMKIHFMDGAELKVGDPLFTIDPRPYEAELAKARATLAQAKATQDLGKIEFARYQNLVRNRSASWEDFDLKKNALEVAEAQVASAQAAVQSAQLNLDYCEIRSPIVGRAGHRLVDIGNVVNGNANGGGASSPLLIIERLDPIYADFTITENDLSSVQRNMKEHTLKVEIRLPDSNDTPRTGDLTFLDNSVQDGTGTVQLRATLANADHHFWPGRFVKVRLILKMQKDAVLIPSEAVQNSAKGPFVYVVNGEMNAELRPVSLGQKHGEQVVVQNGVKASERVVTLGQLAVMPGGKVRLEENPVTPTLSHEGIGGKDASAHEAGAREEKSPLTPALSRQGRGRKEISREGTRGKEEISREGRGGETPVERKSPDEKRPEHKSLEQKPTDAKAPEEKQGGKS